MTLIRAVSAGDVSPDTALVEPPSLPALLGKLTLLPLQTVLVTLLSLVLLRPVTRVVPGGPHHLVQHKLRVLHEVHRLLGHLVVDDSPTSAALLVGEAAGGPASVVTVEQFSDLDGGVWFKLIVEFLFYFFPFSMFRGLHFCHRVFANCFLHCSH